MEKERKIKGLVLELEGWMNLNEEMRPGYKGRQ